MSGWPRQGYLRKAFNTPPWPENSGHVGVCGCIRRLLQPQSVILSESKDPYSATGVSVWFVRFVREYTSARLAPGILRPRDCFALAKQSLRLADMDVFARARHHFQRLLEVGDQVADIFNSHRQTDQLIRYPHLGAMLG